MINSAGALSGFALSGHYTPGMALFYWQDGCITRTDPNGVWQWTRLYRSGGNPVLMKDECAAISPPRPTLPAHLYPDLVSARCASPPVTLRGIYPRTAS